MVRYFKKYNPKQDLLGSDGKWIKFPDFGNGWGGIATDDHNLLREFFMAIARNVGGIAECTYAEFEELKKKVPSSPPWKDTVSEEALKRIAGPFQNAAEKADSKTLIHPSKTSNLTLPDRPKQTAFRPRSVAR